MDPESDLPVLEEDIKDEDSLENQNDLQFCKEKFRQIEWCGPLGRGGD